MTASDTYLGVNLERWKNDMVAHVRDERRRNVLLQKRLDDAQAEIARLQARALESQPLPKQQHSRFEMFRRKSRARMGMSA